MNKGNEEKTGLPFNASIGGKFASKQGLTTELLISLDRNFIKSDNNSAFGRVGISMGYRF